MVWTLFIAFSLSAFLTMLIIASAHRHSKWSADHDVSGPQKMHVNVVPRVGGVGISAGILAGVAALGWKHPALWGALLLLVACALPTLVSGLLEDFTKSVSPRRRLFAAAVSGAMGIVLLDAVLIRSGWPAFDRVLAVVWVGAALTVFTVAGVVHAINIIDGMNGLASMCIAVMMASMCYIAHEVGDTLVAGVALATLGAALGFFVWNYPRGLIFLGDGGAYLLGLLVIELGLMLVHRNARVSPLTPLVLVWYPVLETLFTMYRRKVLRGRPVSMPDGIHLHTLIYRRMMRWAVGGDDPAARTRGNSLTSPFLWVLSSLTVVPATIWWDDTPMLALTLVVFALVYLHFYWRIVRFRTPAWMSNLAGRI